MSDVMLFGVLGMPYEMAMGDEMSRLQFYGRVGEAVERLQKAEAEVLLLQALLKGLTEAGEARRVMINPFTGKLHWEAMDYGGENHLPPCHGGKPCPPADMNAPEVIAWVARQRKDSHAGH